MFQSNVHDEFVDKFVEKALSVGDGFDLAVAVGPLIDSRALSKIESHIADAVAGGKVRCGGERIGKEGTLFQPTVLTGSVRWRPALLR